MITYFLAFVNSFSEISLYFSKKADKSFCFRIIFCEKSCRTIAQSAFLIYNNKDDGFNFKSVCTDLYRWERLVTLSLKDEVFKKIKNGKIAVLGIGVSNLPLINWLISKEASVCARDKKSYDELLPVSKELKNKGVRLILGENYLSGLCEDVIFRAPGIRPDVPEIAAAVGNGSLLTSEMELFFDITPATVLGITGSDGKTTTTTLVYKLLSKEAEKKGYGRVWVGGNIGTPLLDKAEEMTKDDFAVVELSSFQLQTMKRSPHRAIITNITPNHLNWHTDMAEYINAKLKICQNTGISHLTLNAENEITAKIAKDATLPVTLFSSKSSDPLELIGGDSNKASILERDGYIIMRKNNEERKILETSSILLPGRHNVENYMAAISITDGLVSPETIKEIAESFGGVAHRLELVRVKDGVKYYNSSIDSSPTRTAAALSALTKKPIVICGGYDKNIPFEPLAVALCDMAKAVVLTGATAEKIKKALLECEKYSPEKLPIAEKRDFHEAVICASEMAKDGDIVLLSPACASFDAFKNFEHRGNVFREIVNNL